MEQSVARLYKAIFCFIFACMDFADLIEELEEQGLIQQEIADGAGTGQSNISAIKNRGTVPKWPLGQELIGLLKEHCPDSKLLKAVRLAQCL